MKLEGRHILITGAAKRLARAISEMLLDYDIKLSAHYFKSESDIASLQVQAQRQGRGFRSFQADLRDVSQIQALVHAAEQTFGPVHILINSAATFYPTPPLSCSVEQWNDFHHLNLRAPFFLAQAVSAGMARDGGTIINLVDSNVERTLPNFSPYLASKGGLITLTRNLAVELAPRIRVNAISPGPVLPPEHYKKQDNQQSLENTLLRRWGSPADIAKAALFLIESEYITGINLCVDGGRALC